VTKITTATDEQWEAVESLRLRWLNEYQTAQYPVSQIVAVAKLFAPQNIPIWVVDSPLVARFISVLTQPPDDNLNSNLAANLNANLESNLNSNLESNLDGNLQYNLYETLNANLHENLHANLHDNLHENLYGNLQDNLDSNLNDNLRYYCGVWWNAWCGYYDGGEILGVPRHDKHDLFAAWNHACPVWMWSDSQIFILRRPREIHWRTDGIPGFHNDSGPAVFYSPLFQLWMIEGVSVDEQIVMHPETQTIEQIHNEKNSEVQRIRIDRFGWPRYLAESGAVVIDSRRNDIDGTKEALMDSRNGQRRLVCSCPSTAKVFAMHVPRETETCEQAQRWLAGNRDIRVIGAS